VQWLWNQQSADGAWHSETHAVLRDGSALTPYILYYLLQVSNTIYPHDKESIRSAIEFIRKDIRHAIRDTIDAKAILNYPNYSAAYALRVLHLTQTDTSLQRLIAEHLLKQQFLEHRGFNQYDIAFGGWGYGEQDLEPRDNGHEDLSHTRRILEALIETRNMDTTWLGKNQSYLIQHAFSEKSEPFWTYRNECLGAAELFLKGVQRSPDDTRLYEGCTDRNKLPYDGGFVSSMSTISTNKSIPIEIAGAGLFYPSYATATCDGLLALHAMGLSSSKAFQDAAHWLEKNQSIDVIDGLSKDDPEQWYLIMHYYHWAVRAEAMTAAGIEGPWKENLRKALIDEQLENGSYVNPLGGVNKEDDPLMATIFCVQALTNVVNQ
jgi:hypothetical protein